jgi:hypothetical protein
MAAAFRLAGNEAEARAPFFLLIAANWLLAWACVTQLSALKPKNRASCATRCACLSRRSSAHGC